MSVAIAKPSPYLLVVDAITDGVPRVTVTVFNVPEGGFIRVQRTSGGDTMTVQGLRSRQVNEADVFTDWAAPLNRESVYTVLVDGEEVSTAAVTLTSEYAWIQDPLHPDLAIPVASYGFKPGALLLRGTALKSVAYQNEVTQMRVMGSRYPTTTAGQRAGASGFDLSMWSDEDEVAGEFRRMVLDSPILLFRPLPLHVPLPPVCYLSAEVTEEPVTTHFKGGHLTRWVVSADVVQAVVQAALSGFITYGQVDDLLGGYTYAEVQASAASTTYLDWQKNPMIFMSL